MALLKIVCLVFSLLFFKSSNASELNPKDYDYKTKLIVLFLIISVISELIFSLYSTLLGLGYNYITSVLDQLLKINEDEKRTKKIPFPFKQFVAPVLRGVVLFLLFVLLTLVLRRYIYTPEVK